MKKIAVVIKEKALLFKYKTKKLTEPNLLNTNVISNNELVFSDEYLQYNVKLVGLFICDLAKERGINEVTVSDNLIGELVIGIISQIPSVEKLTITDDVNLSYTLCENISQTKNIKILNCYGIPQFMIEKLDKCNISVESRYEVLFTSNFMAENNLTSFSKIYYKTNMRIGEVLNTEDVLDIKTFCAINKYLKIIHFDKYNLDNIKIIIDILKEFKKRNVAIQIHDDIEDEKDIVLLREMNKELKKKNKIQISLVYSKDYLEKNYLQEVIFTTLKVCALIIFLIIVAVLGYIFYNNYKSEKKVTIIKNEINEIMDMTDEELDNNQEDIEEDTMGMIHSYHKLYKVNNDTAGWLNVKGTKIDYPVVKATDNSYYLNKNIYKEKDYNGWVFMDYRNNIEELDDNTIVYAHNRFTSGVMFGTLPNLRKNSWLKNKSNYTITFNTLYKEGNWKIFSMYGIDVTNDYLVVNFREDEEKQEFIDMLLERSEYDFGTKVTVKDKILTLSTCLDNNQRFVVHAVLIDDKES